MDALVDVYRNKSACETLSITTDERCLQARAQLESAQRLDPYSEQAQTRPTLLEAYPKEPATQAEYEIWLSPFLTVDAVKAKAYECLELSGGGGRVGDEHVQALTLYHAFCVEMRAKYDPLALDEAAEYAEWNQEVLRTHTPEFVGGEDGI